MPKVDLGKFTPQQTKELAIEALGWLTLEQRLAAVLATFSKDERVELVIRLDEVQHEGESQDVQS